MTRLAPLAVLAAFVAACASPEAKRTRAGGPGADPGNRGAVLEFHHGARPYYDTPCVTKPVPCDGPAPIFGQSWKP